MPRAARITTAPRSPAMSIIPHKHAQPEAVPRPSSGGPPAAASWSAAAISRRRPRATTCSTTASAFRGRCNTRCTTRATKDPKTMQLGFGFHADPVDPLLQSSDPSFRPVDIEFAPDGSLYLCDWFNPLVGHMQHSIRDPNRDHTHGRIWRIHYTKRPLVKPAKIAGEPIAALLDLLRDASRKSERTIACGRELWNRPTSEVIGETAKWLAGFGQERSGTSITSSKPSGCTRRTTRSTSRCSRTCCARPISARGPPRRACSATGATASISRWSLLRQQVNDEHPRVRLEAVRALSFFSSQEAIDVAVESLRARSGRLPEVHAQRNDEHAGAAGERPEPPSRTKAPIGTNAMRIGIQGAAGEQIGLEGQVQSADGYDRCSICYVVSLLLVCAVMTPDGRFGSAVGALRQAARKRPRAGGAAGDDRGDDLHPRRGG